MSEVALLTAVRNNIRNVGEYKDIQVDVELDEVAPATVGRVYIAVTPGTITAGPRHDTSGGVVDEIHQCLIVLIVRANRVARDRTRDLFLDNLSGFNVHLEKIRDAIDFSYDVNNDANAIITDTENSSEGFVEPLRFASIGPPRPMPAEIFGAGQSGELKAGMGRTITFNGARRIRTR